MTNLTEDEYTCLMILNEGGPLIYMKDTRWASPLDSLEAKQYAAVGGHLFAQTGNKNFKITAMGKRALADHEKGHDEGLAALIERTGDISRLQASMREKMMQAGALLVEAARLGAKATSQSEFHAFSQILDEIKRRAKQDLLK